MKAWLAGWAGWLAGLDWLGLAGDCIFSMDKFRRASPSARLWWNLSSQ